MYFFKSFGCFTISSDKVTDCDSNDGGCSTTDHVMTSNRDRYNNNNGVKKFTLEDIKKRSSSWKVIGSGGFSTVYLAGLPDLGLTAVKVQSACTERLSRVHEQELQILMRLKHPNIIKFVGYCDDDSREEERMLLLEYVSNGTLHDKLLLGPLTLTWKARTLIAFQLAHALDYLHGIQIIHGDIKASNILLDQQQNCKLCDFGSAKFVFTSMVLPPSSSKMIIGSQGYVDPHYLKTGLVSKKNDIYSFGVVLLQLITGKQAFSMETGERLTDIVNINRPAMINEEVVDPKLIRHGINLEEVMAMVSLAGMCINSSPMARPSANEIVATMRRQLFQSI